MWQICGYIPQTIMPVEPDITQKAAQLSTSFFIETFIHAKEKVLICAAVFVTFFNLINLLAYHGAMGGVGHKTVQRLSGGLYLVFGTHG